MKRRIISLLLAVMMITGLAGVLSYAADTSSLQYWIGLAQNQPTKSITIPGSLTVFADTTIPAGVTINTSSGTVLTLNEDVRVDGVLNINGYLYANGGSLTGSGIITYPKMDINTTPSKFTLNNNWWVTPSNVSSLYPNNSYSPYVYSYSPYYNSVNPYYYNGVYYYYNNGQIYYVNGNYYVDTSAPYGYCSIHKTTPLQYCYICKDYECPICDTHYSKPTITNYCTVHKVNYSYCPICQKYYCPYEETHTHSANSTIYGYLNSYYLSNYYYPDYYYQNYRCASPVANINSGNVTEGTKVTLSTATTGAVIYYTLDGSAPSVGAYRYTGPITINKDTTLKAISALNGYITSGVSTYNYNVASAFKYKDISQYDGLSATLRSLRKYGVFADGEMFYPKASFSYDDLMSALRAIGCDTSKVTLDDEANLSKITALTYNDFVYIAYKVLRANNMIDSPQRSSSETLNQLRNHNDITSAQIYKAAFASFIENELFYDLEFNPTAEAPRYQLATVLENALYAK